MRKNIKSFLLPLILASMVDDSYRVRRIHSNNHPKPLKRDEKNRIEREFDINGKKIMAYSRKDAIKRLRHKEQKTICLCNVSFFIFIERSAGL